MTSMPYWLAAVTVGVAGGLLGGMLGVGGGIIMMPLLMGWLGKSIHDAKACSLGIICLVAISGTVEHQRQGRLDWRLILIAGVAAAIASPLGAAYSNRLPREILMRMFAVLLIGTGIAYLVNPSGPRR
jgi:uncharacterized membrane protein YfcA